MLEPTRRQVVQNGLRPEIICPLCNLTGTVQINFLVWQETRYVHGTCGGCHSHWSFPDRRKPQGSSPEAARRSERRSVETS